MTKKPESFSSLKSWVFKTVLGLGVVAVLTSLNTAPILADGPEGTAKTSRHGVVLFDDDSVTEKLLAQCNADPDLAQAVFEDLVPAGGEKFLLSRGRNITIKVPNGNDWLSRDGWVVNQIGSYGGWVPAWGQKDIWGIPVQDAVTQRWSYVPSVYIAQAWRDPSAPNEAPKPAILRVTVTCPDPEKGLVW